MKKSNKFLFAILFLIIVTIIFLASNYPPAKNPDPNETNINLALEKGQKYLISSFSSQHFYDDPYFDCEYIKEHKLFYPCAQSYRSADAAIDLIFIRDSVENHKMLNDQIELAEIYLKNFMKEMENGPISTSYLDNTTEIGYGLDSYCIIALIYNNTKMITQIKNSIKNLGWTSNDLKNTGFRKITDESWCIEALIVGNVNKTLVENLMDKKVNETEIWLESDDYTVNKIYAAMHTLLLLDYAEKNDYNVTKYNLQYKEFQDFLAIKTKDFDIERNNLVTINILYTLSETNYNNEEFMRNLASFVLKIQNDDGGWKLTQAMMNEGKSFTTLRGILTLEKYRQCCI